MNNNSDSICKDKMASQERSLTPAVLGIPSVSHGAKLPPNMSSQEKKDLLMKVEAFRQARRDRLMAHILAKGKQSSHLKSSTNFPKPKPKTKVNSAPGTEINQSNCNGRKTVFERLYEKAGKQPMAKRLEENKQDKLNNIKKPQNFKFSSCQSQDKRIKAPKIIVTSEESKPVNDSGPSFEQVSLQDTVAEDETKIFPVDSQEVEMVNKDTTSEQHAPVLGTASKTVKDLNMEETENVIMSNGTVIDKEEKENHEKCHEQFKSGNINGYEKDLGLKKAKIFKNERKTNTEIVQNAPLRRSISLIFRKKMGNYESAIHRTQSVCNLEELVKDEKKDDVSKANKNEDFNLRFNKNEIGANPNKGTKTVSFLTPKNNALNAFHLRNKLENWLVENGHSIETYKHLRCFGLAVEEVKCTPFHRQQKVHDSPNTSFYSTAPNTPMADIIDESDKENVTPPPSYPKVEKVDLKDVEGWLSDLHQLIVHVKYPGDRCEEWLNAISKKFPGCSQLPIYWECVAAMNGNPSGAALDGLQEESKNCQKDEVEDSLAELLDKLVIDEKCKSASKIERGLSVKNIFKSKTVKFALKEKAIKQLDPVLGKEAPQKVLVATPVRRSARLQTQNKTNVIMSLESLDPELRSSLSFEPNDALFT